jgi:hypothetical protein
MVRRSQYIPTKTIWIFCEGKQTEKNYFQKYKAIERIPFQIKVLDSPNKRAQDLVRYCISYISKNHFRFQSDDEIFCIFDRNANTNQDLNKAIKFAQEENIRIIFSNPCFEYWILCHYIYHQSAIEYNSLKNKIERYIPQYKKNDKDIYTKTKEKISNAIRNSERGYTKHEQNGINCISRESNPVTSVFNLIRYLNDLKNSRI